MSKRETKNNIPRSEHPRPDLERKNWLNLNGTWQFEIDNSRVGVDRGYEKRDDFKGKILVPFCPESPLSGVGHRDFIFGCWYRRTFTLPKSFAGNRTLLHFGACYYAARIYVNGALAGTHKGGHTPFVFDVTELLKEGENALTVYAESDVRSGLQVAGKQSYLADSFGCHYTRTTGLWQTVWLESVPAARVISYRAYPSVSNGSVSLAVSVTPKALGGLLTVSARYEGREVGKARCAVTSLSPTVTVELSEVWFWEVGCGRLYDLVFTLQSEDAETTDTLNGYFGLREVSLSKEKGLTVNGRTVFGRFVLDQGFYPDGVITAPSDEALRFDIEAAMKAGFNGARLHQKVFEPRFLYHADRLGYMVFGETGNWGLDATRPEAIYNFLPEWLEELERDFSHPSLIGWCPFNETWDKDRHPQCNLFIDSIYDITKVYDRTRPVIANSGSWPTSRSDTNDVHDYEQDPKKFATYYEGAERGEILDQLKRADPNRQHFNPALPVFVSEYGGIKWVMEEDASAWGYGESVKSEEEFFQRLEGLTDVLLQNRGIFGFCYTQLTDVEQEQNGVLTYDRRFKFDPERFAAIFAKPAAIEE